MNQPILVSTTIVPAASIEAAQGSNALTDDELNVVAGGAKTLVEAFMDGFAKGAGIECVKTSKSIVCF